MAKCRGSVLESRLCLDYSLKKSDLGKGLIIHSL